MKTVSVKVASAVIAGLGLTAGVVGAVGAANGSVGSTGEDSSNDVVVTSDDRREVNKNATVNAQNNNPQSASTGNADVDDGEEDGTAESGEASNNSDFDGAVTVGQGGSGADDDNNVSSFDDDSAGGSGGASGSIDGETGEDSDNSVDVDSTVRRNYNSNATVNVQNNSSQSATSGDATVSGGEEGGSATSGAATNTSTSRFDLNVQQ